MFILIIEQLVILNFKELGVRCFLSINADTLPANVKKGEKTTYRGMMFEGEEI